MSDKPNKTVIYTRHIVKDEGKKGNVFRRMFKKHPKNQLKISVPVI